MNPARARLVGRPRRAFVRALPPCTLAGRGCSRANLIPIACPPRPAPRCPRRCAAQIHSLWAYGFERKSASMKPPATAHPSKCVLVPLPTGNRQGAPACRKKKTPDESGVFSGSGGGGGNRNRLGALIISSTSRQLSAHGLDISPLSARSACLVSPRPSPHVRLGFGEMLEKRGASVSRPNCKEAGTAAPIVLVLNQATGGQVLQQPLESRRAYIVVQIAPQL